MNLNKFPQLELDMMAISNVKYVPIFNIFVKDLSVDWYARLGKYIKCKGTVVSHKVYPKNKIDDDTLGIIFTTTTLSGVVLDRMFGVPFIHSQFGNSFCENMIFEGCASYFINFHDTKMHISYDHKGVKIEVHKDTKPEIIYEILCKLVEKFIQNEPA